MSSNNTVYTELIVYTGFWINHDYPAPVGATLTVSLRWGNYLIAALSSLIAWSGTSLWSLLMYLMHRRYGMRHSKDVLDHQIQILLRGPGSVYDAIMEVWDMQSIVYISSSSVISQY